MEIPSFRSSRLAILVLAALLFGAGCSSSSRDMALREGPAAPAPVHYASGVFDGKHARRLVSPHYLIDTTILDDDLVATLPQLMEGALTQYRRLAPAIPPSDRPMRCNVFADRAQWAQFTQANAGEDAKVYLQINRGGYTVDDWYVAYFIGDIGTWNVAAHEGFHQYVARHFRRRPPPFLEEGLACLFEDVKWDGELPRWNLSVNPTRTTGVRKTIERGALIPLDQLCTTHAGQIVNTTSARIEGFYAQSWGFARFLWDGDGGRYRPVLQKMLADLASAEADGPAGSDTGAERRWDPESAKPLLERYLGKSLPEIDHAYQAFLHHLVNEDRSSDRDT